MAQLEQIITAESKPDYDDWGIDSYWSCSQWIEYHKALKNKYGKDQANQFWLTAWEKQDTFEHDLSWCKYDSSFADYFADQGIDVGHIISKLFGSAGKVVDAVENVAESATSSTKALKFVVPTLIVTLGIFLIFYGYKKVKQA